MSNPELKFSVSIFPSMSKRGQHAVAISNKNEESLVIGFTSDPEQTKRGLSKILNTNAAWDYNADMNYHTLQVTTPATS